MEKKLFLFDAYALIYRAHFAFINNPRINSKGLNTSAIFGFCNSLLEVINNHEPTHLGVVFDPPGGSNREEIFTEYKANRQEMPEDIRKAIPYIFEILKAMNIQVEMVSGFEADDLIGTLSKQAEKMGFKVFMMTPDKDFGQLVSENIFIYKPGRSGNPSEILGPKEVCEKFEVEHPEQVIDILGLWGDTVDNIPGIPGIGEKTAKKLIGIYGSIENLLANTQDLKGKQKENVENFADQGLISKKLATIILDCPVEFNESIYKRKEIDEKALTDILKELEFNQLGKRILGKPIYQEKQMDLFASSENEPEPTTNLQDFSSTKPDYKLIQTREQHLNFIKELSSKDAVAFDTETTSLEIDKAKLLGISFSFSKNTAFYCDLSKEETLIDLYKEFFHSKTIKIAHNLKYDYGILFKYGIQINEFCFDTMIAHYLIDPEKRHNLDQLSRTILNYDPIPIESLIGSKTKPTKKMEEVEIDVLKNYAAEDADLTFQLYQNLSKELKNLDLEDLFYNIEIPLMKVLYDMERQGIKINTASLSNFSKELNISLTNLKQSIFQLSEAEFNIDSPKQLGEVIFGKLNLDEKAKKTKTGQYKTDEATLNKLNGVHPIISDILNYRTRKKLLSTYVDALPKLISPVTNKIHTNYMQAVTSTGRLSSNKPNLQNIPIRTELGKEIRKAFCSSDSNHLLLCADYSQIELRIIAGLSKDESMINAFTIGRDIHAETASKIFHVNLEDVSQEMRSKAKMVNFGIIYGISAFGLSQRLGVKRTEAKEIIDNYFLEFPKIKEYMDSTISYAKEKGYVETIFKRKRFLPNISSGNATMRGFDERNAINAPIQGSAADIIKLAMVNIHKKILIQKMESKLLLQVHDELVLDMVKDEQQDLEKLVKQEMMEAVKFNVPLEVEIGSGENWLMAH
ncbi:MAG: DNA polymerase I [Crocinitomicaceae bacterium]|nr:DNA polymerase I [Crocinitomicaceae bacterium]